MSADSAKKKKSSTSPPPPPSSSSSFPSSYPYRVDYNDHFETPLRAYEDIVPLLDLVSTAASSSTAAAAASSSDGPSASRGAASSLSSKQGKRKRSSPTGEGRHPSDGARQHLRSNQTLYDPYYCAGRTATLLKSLNFTSVIHAKRDFYADISNDAIPPHDTLVTNPPYSSNHKERCLDFALRGLRERGRKFFLLMPNYVVQKEYYREFVSGSRADGGGDDVVDDVVYVVPEFPYEYDHPEGTGHDVPPFASLWFCGIGKELVKEAREAYRKRGGGGGPKIACSLDELQALGAVRGGKRKNPKQRKKIRQQMMAASAAAAAADGRVGVGVKAADVQSTKSGAGVQHAGQEQRKRPKSSTSKDSQAKSKKSKFRDANGVRKKRRF